MPLSLDGAHPLTGPDHARYSSYAAVQSAGDLLARLDYNTSGKGMGLRGGTFQIAPHGGGKPAALAMWRPGDIRMRTLICLLVLGCLTACATCKSSDSYEVCRTKQRDHAHPRP